MPNKQKSWLKKILRIFRRRIILFTIVSVILTMISAVAVYGVYRYWHPPLLQFDTHDLAKKLTIQTTKGSFTVELDQSAPLATAQLTRLARLGFYDGIRIHRIVSGFIIQMGDPLTKYADAKNYWGQGGSAVTFPNEVHDNDEVTAGTVAMVDVGGGRYGSQFMILLRDAPWLRGKITVVGHINEGMGSVQAIADIPTSVTDIPAEDVQVISITAL